MFHHNLKKVKDSLTKWSKEFLGNIFQEISTLKEVSEARDKKFEELPSGTNRQRLFKA